MTQFSTLTAQNFFLRIADIIFLVSSVDPGLKLQIEGAAQKFVVHEANPDLTIETRWEDLSSMGARGKKVFDSGVLWQLYNDKGKYSFSFTSPAIGPIPYKVAVTNKDFTRGEVSLHYSYFHSDKPVYPLEYPLDELLVVNLLAQGKGAEAHACGIVDSNGDGRLFVGQSEAGKTTMARLWQNEPRITILSDDRIILRKMDETLWMYGTPWHGEGRLSSAVRAPLKRIYFLYHAKKNELIQQGRAEALTRLFACSFPPFFDPSGLEYTLGFYEEIIEATPCYELRFLPDESVVEFILNDL